MRIVAPIAQNVCSWDNSDLRRRPLFRVRITDARTRPSVRCCVDAFAICGTQMSCRRSTAKRLLHELLCLNLLFHPTAQSPHGQGPHRIDHKTAFRRFRHPQADRLPPQPAPISQRRQSIRGRMSLIRLYVPAAAEWLPNLRAERLAFPTGKHDDIVDALGLVGQLMDKFAPGRLPIEAFEWKGDNGYSREIDVSGPLRDSFMTL